MNSRCRERVEQLNAVALIAGVWIGIGDGPIRPFKREGARNGVILHANVPNALLSDAPALEHAGISRKPNVPGVWLFHIDPRVDRRGCAITLHGGRRWVVAVGQL